MSVMPSVLPVTESRAERVAVTGLGTPPGLHVWRAGNRVGESPVWDVDSKSLLWIDVRAPAVLRLDPLRATLLRWTLPDVVGALGLATGGCVVLALQRSLALLHLASGKLTPVLEVAGEPAGNRLNDGKVSPSGRWFVFGSMDDRPADKQATGSIHAAACDGTVNKLWQGLTVANGIAFSADATALYFSDSFAGQVWRAPWDESRGTMGLPRLICKLDEAAGRPDGATIDALGHYWSAGVSAGCLNRLDADGAKVQRLALPIRAPTMPCFGGDELADLYITSLVRPGWTKGASDVDGDLVCWPGAGRGQPSPRWRWQV